jgi:hypothetical protein
MSHGGSRQSLRSCHPVDDHVKIHLQNPHESERSPSSVGKPGSFLLIAICEALPPEGAGQIPGVLHRLAERESMSPAERHIFETCADTSAARGPARPKRPAFQVIEGGAA